MRFITKRVKDRTPQIKHTSINRVENVISNTVVPTEQIKETTNDSVDAKPIVVEEENKEVETPTVDTETVEIPTTQKKNVRKRKTVNKENNTIEK